MREFLRISGQVDRVDDYTVPTRMLPAVDFFLRYVVSAIVSYHPGPTALPKLSIGVGTGTAQPAAVVLRDLLARR